MLNTKIMSASLKLMPKLVYYSPKTNVIIMKIIWLIIIVVIIK